MIITVEQLIKLDATKEDAEKYCQYLNKYMEKYEINTIERVRHCVAQICVESGCFRTKKEDLFYSAKRLTEVWPKRFPTIESATPYAKNPVALAEKVYGGRMGNNNPGEGGKYLGRGLKQLTGKENYTNFSRDTGIDAVNNPELLEQPEYACLSACWFWNSKKLNKIADKGGEEVVKEITLIVNGGLTAYNERLKYYKKAVGVFK